MIQQQEWLVQMAHRLVKRVSFLVSNRMRERRWGEGVGGGGGQRDL